MMNSNLVVFFLLASSRLQDSDVTGFHYHRLILCPGRGCGAWLSFQDNFSHSGHVFIPRDWREYINNAYFLLPVGVDLLVSFARDPSSSARPTMS